MAPLPARSTVHGSCRAAPVAAQPRKRPARRIAAGSPRARTRCGSWTASSGCWPSQPRRDPDRRRLLPAGLAAGRASENATSLAAVQTRSAPRCPRLLTKRSASTAAAAASPPTGGQLRASASPDRLLAPTRKPAATTSGPPDTLRWLEDRPPADDIAGCRRLDDYRRWYNTERRHQASAAHPAAAVDSPTRPARRRADPTADRHPHARVPMRRRRVDGSVIGLAKRWTRAQTTVFRTGDHVVVFIDAHADRTLDLDRSR